MTSFLICSGVFVLAMVAAGLVRILRGPAAADRIMAATARELGYMLVTRDRPLLHYSEQGYIRALAC